LNGGASSVSSAISFTILDVNARGLDVGIHFGEHEGYRRPVEFRILGAVEVVEEGNGTVSLGGPKQRAVLAHLLIRANDLVPTELLIDEVWGEEPPEAVRGALQTHTSHLRKALGPGRLEGSRAGYVLHVDPSEIDAHRFESLLRDARRLLPLDPKVAVAAYDEALSLWHGPAFGDLAGEPSIGAEAARLDELRLGAVEDRIEALLTLGEHRGVIAELETLVTRYPLRERFWAQLMLAFYRAGRQAESLTTFQRAREILADELGIDPSPELRRLHERILQQSPDLDLEGTPLRGYRLLERVGSGSFGTVWRAIQPKVGRDVAVKAIHPHLANDPDFIRRFETEAQIVARLEHPHIVPLYDYWREPGGAYLVMRFLRGGCLGDAIDEGPMEVERAARLIGQVSDALAAAHRQGVVHRDVKPSNILLDHEGNAYLADFGIAKDLSAQEVTETGGVKGSLLYLAPEQVRGEPVTSRTDLYALGMILYEVLAGRHPFADVPDLAVFERQLRQPLPPLSERRPELPSAVNEVIVGATAKDPELRFPDTLAMAAALREAIASGTPVVPTQTGVEARNPYKGLRPFVEADTHDFFGREAFVERLLEQWRDPIHPARFLAVVGPSGIGKSSAVRAGLVPAIRAGAIDGSEEWFVAELVPGAHPMEELEAALVRVARQPPPGLLRLLESGPRGLVKSVERIVPDGAELLLVVDQFEEAFTLTDDEAERTLLLESLRVAAADPASRTRIVVTLRADFYDRPLNYPRFGELLGASSEVVTPLAPDELERAIVRPAESVGLRVEPALLAQIASDVAEQPGALPLVQYALTELFDRRNEGRLTLAAYRDIGGIAGALAARAEQLYATRDQRGQESVRQLFLRLVTLGEGVADTRRRVPISELTAIEIDPELTQSAIEAFGYHRLLTFDRDPATREPTVEVAHEALLRSWPRLRGWIDADREDLRTLRRLADASHEWERSGRDPSFLLRGSRLDQFETWVGRTDLALGRAELGYLRAGATRRDEERAAESARQTHERALERRSVKRLRALVLVFAVAALVATSLTVIATNQSRRAERESRVATARELASAAVANVEVDPERAVLLAIQAVDTTRSADGSVLPEAEEALHRAVTASRVLLSVPGLGGHLDWSSTGLFVTEGPGEGIIDIRDATTGERVLAFEGHNGDVTDVAFSRDGSRLATTGDDGMLKVWNPSTGDLLASRSGDGTALGPSFSEDGSLVAGVWNNGDDDEVGVLDVLTDRVVWTHPMSMAADTALSPDGKHLAVTAIHRNGKVFDLETGEGAFEFKTGLSVGDPSIRGASWSPDGRYIATTGSLGVPQIWDAETGKLRFKLLGHAGFVASVAWSPSTSTGKTSHLVTGGLEGTAKVWDIGQHGVREVLSLSAQEMGSGIVGVAFSPDGNRVMAGNVDLSAVKIWDIGPDGDAEWGNFRSTSGLFSAVEFMPDGRRLVATSHSGSALTVWDLQDERPVRTIATTGIRQVYSTDVSPDGALIAAGGDAIHFPIGDALGVWRSSTGERLFGVKHRFSVYAVAFSPDGDHLVTAGWRGTAKIIDRSGQVIQILKDEHGYVLNSAQFSPDGRLIATAALGHDLVTIWDWQRGTVIRTINGKDLVDFDPRMSRIATLDQEGRVEIRDLQGGKRLAALPAQPGRLYDVTFSPDGSLIATAGDDGTVRLFDADTGTQHMVLRGHACAVDNVAFSLDGTKLASSSACDGVRIWALDIDDLLEIARQNVTRSLTNEECRQYLHLHACSTD
jgi:WD40 repeat protein/DNA-binding SARP family transcriptional activator